MALGETGSPCPPPALIALNVPAQGGEGFVSLPRPVAWTSPSAEVWFFLSAREAICPRMAVCVRQAGEVVLQRYFVFLLAGLT